MRLLDTRTQELKFFADSDDPSGPKIPGYAILSHTWEDDEVLFADIVSQGRNWVEKAGAEKVLGSCQLAKNEGYDYIWVDTCCIDKSSSAELSEAINSMFDWYMKAEVCYVYLTDVPEDSLIDNCRWFKRGWTLQELIAPTSVKFYDKKWNFISDKISISSKLASITGIDAALLRGGHSLHPPLLQDHDIDSAKHDKGCNGKPNLISIRAQLEDYCVAQKMSWASRRETTRDEDKAYSLMGLFRVNMPLLYGEGGNKAFFRLEKEILGITHDQSILAIDSYASGQLKRALASHPDQFRHSGKIHYKPVSTQVARLNMLRPMTTDLTKIGVVVELLVVPETHPTFDTVVSWFGILDFQMGSNPLARPAIPLRPIEQAEDWVFCIRKEGLFEMSPEHPHHARDLRVLTGSSTLETDPDRKGHSARAVIIQIDLWIGKVDTQAMRRRRITILQSYGAFYGRYSQCDDGLPTPIRCVSNSPLCRPYSVESRSRGNAILQKPGYPRLIIEIFKDENTQTATGYSSSIWLLEDIHPSYKTGPDNAETAGELFVKLNNKRKPHPLGKPGFICTGGWVHYGSNKLVVHGLSDLQVEVKVAPLEFLDWTTPEVTVITTRS